MISGSSSSSAADSSSQLHAAAAAASCNSFMDHRLQTALLRHPSISQDHQIVAALLQTSQQLQDAVTQLLPGQLPVVLHARKLQQVIGLAHWMQKHGGLLQELAVHVAGSRYESQYTRGWPPAAVAALAAALQQAAAAAVAPLQLCSFKMTGALASTDLLQQLAAVHLTQLHAVVDMCSRDSRIAVRALSSLRSLDLYDYAVVQHWHAAGTTVFPLLAGLRQLTELRLGVLTPLQLHHLASELMASRPPQLQELHVDASAHPEWQLKLLARWLKAFASIVTSLRFYDTGYSSPVWLSGWAELVAALDAWQATAAMPTDGAATVYQRALAADSRGWQLQSLSTMLGAGETSQCTPVC
jgi:hypothetical protein